MKPFITYNGIEQVQVDIPGIGTVVVPIPARVTYGSNSYPVIVSSLLRPVKGKCDIDAWNAAITARDASDDPATIVLACSPALIRYALIDDVTITLPDERYLDAKYFPTWCHEVGHHITRPDLFNAAAMAGPAYLLDDVQAEIDADNFAMQFVSAEALLDNTCYITREYLLELNRRSGTTIVEVPAMEGMPELLRTLSPDRVDNLLAHMAA